LKNCYLFNTSRSHFKILRQRSEMTHQQRMSRSGSAVIERTVGEWRQCPPLAFVLKDILSTCCNTDDVM